MSSQNIFPVLSDSIDSARDKLQDLIDAEKESIQYRREAREETKAQARALKEAEEGVERLKNMTAELNQETQELTVSTEGLTEARSSYKKSAQIRRRVDQKAIPANRDQVRALGSGEKRSIRKSQGSGSGHDCHRGVLPARARENP